VKKVAAFVTLRGPSLAKVVLVRRVSSCRSRQASPVGPIEALPPGRSRVTRKGDGDVNGGLVQGVEASVPQEIGTEVEPRAKQVMRGSGRRDR